MAVKKFLTDIDFSQNQSISRVIENRTTPPATPVEGQEYYDTVLNQAYFFDGTSWVQYGGGSGSVTSVGLTMPTAFSVANSPITTAGDINVTANGVASQYIRGDGQLATLPTNTGGGGSVTYYLNGSINQGTFGGNTYYQMSRNAIVGAGTDFNINADGFIARFITDANDPNVLQIPVGAWNLGFFFSASSGGGSPEFYTNIYKTDGTTFTLLGTNSATPEVITGGTAIDQYFFSVAIPTNTLLVTDRIAIDIYVVHSGRIITLHTEDSLCEVITTLSTGITALNGLTEQTQYLAVGTSGTDFAISSSGDTHTFNLPIASATKTGKLSDTDWSAFNNKVDDNIYTANGTLTGIRTLSQLLFGLRFLGTGGTTKIEQNNGAGLSASMTTVLTNIILQVINGVNTGSFDITDARIEGIVTGTVSTSQYTQTELQFLNFVTGALGNTNYTQTETSLDISAENGITGFVSNIQQVFNAIKLVLSDAGSIEITSLKVLPTGVQINGLYLLPIADGLAGQVMTTDGAGNVTFQTPSSGTNIYNSDGTLTGARVLTLNGNLLSFVGTNGSVKFNGGNQLSVEGTGINEPSLIVNGANAIRKNFEIQTAGVTRWKIRTGGTEAGSNTGTNWTIARYSDSGVFIATAIEINRANGTITFNGQYAFPITDGTAGQVMTTDGGGQLSFADVTALPSFIPFLQQTEIIRGAIALNNSTTLGTYGAYTPSVTGTSVALLMSSATVTKLPKLRILTTGATINSRVGVIFGSQSLIQSLEQGFRFTGSYVFSDVSAGGVQFFVPNARQFVGLTGTTTLIAISNTVTVQSLTDIIGMGSDTGDTNLQIFHNDASGLATKIDLGASFPANKTGAVANGISYQLELYAPFGATTVNYRVTNQFDGTQTQGTISTNLPASTTLLCPQVCRTSGSTAQNVAIDFVQLNCYTLN
jgi:hypothetical protein